MSSVLLYDWISAYYPMQCMTRKQYISPQDQLHDLKTHAEPTSITSQTVENSFFRPDEHRSNLMVRDLPRVWE